MELGVQNNDEVLITGQRREGDITNSSEVNAEGRLNSASLTLHA